MTDLMRFVFIETLPDTMEENTLYVSMDYATVVHKCCCGCGRQVVTPLNPAGWKLTFDGVGVSLHPSIGNWNFDCKSHYFITDSKVRWAEKWSQEQIDAVQAKDINDLRSFYGKEKDATSAKQPIHPRPKIGIIARVMRSIFGR